MTTDKTHERFIEMPEAICRMAEQTAQGNKTMTNNKTTALIAEQKTCKAMTKAKRGFYGHVPSHQCTKLAVIGDYCKKHAGKEALAAFEQPAVRELSVDEVAHNIRIYINVSDIEFDGDGGDKCAKDIAKELARLGTIRVVEG